MKSVGIIGGLGPETTAEFYLDLVFSCQERNAVQRPSILIASVPLPYEIESEAIGKGTGFERILPFLIKEAKRLEQAGADFIVMPCNSLHVFIEDIRKSVSVPVLSIVEETVSFLKSEGFNSVGIVSTSATIKNKLYEHAFKESEIAYATPDAYEQAKMGNIILNLVRGIHTSKDRDELVKIIRTFKEKHVDCIVLACTDLQILIPEVDALKIFDTMKIFAQNTVKYMLEET
ncbi:MAG: aspartate/glutamate racemase family protein [Candidatus Woesearchaeota archaeon]